MQGKDNLPHYTSLIWGRSLRLDWLNSVSVNDYPSARSLDWHEHDEMEVIFPVRGRFHYEFKDGHELDVDSNSFVCIPPNVCHRLRDAIDAPGNRFSLHLRRVMCGMKAGALTSAEYKRIYNSLLGRQCARLGLSPIQKMATTNLWKLIGKQKPGRAVMNVPKIRLLVCQLLCESESPPKRMPEKSSNEIIKEATKWLMENAAHSVNLDDLVSFIGYSRIRLFSLFKDYTGQTPGEYLRGVRIEKAKELLAESSLTTAEIAKACGLGDPAHFCRLFRKMTGFTPIRWRLLKKTFKAPIGVTSHKYRAST